MRQTLSPCLLLTSLLVVACGCSNVSPVIEPVPEVFLPESWGTGHSATTGRTVPQDWWMGFSDEALNAAVERALDHNADVAVAAARLRQAEATARIAGADVVPSIQIGLNGLRRKQNFIGFPIPGAEDSVLSTVATNLGVSLQTSWEVDLWGRIGATTREAMANAQAAEADVAGVRLSIAGQTVKAWFAAAESALQVRLAKQTVQSLNAAATQVRARFEGGLRPSLDLRLALANLANAEALLQARRQQLDGALRRVEVLLGSYPGRRIEAPMALPQLPGPVPPGLPSNLVSRRPDLAAAERRLASAQQRLGIARASLYPRLSLTASGGTATGGLKDLIDGDFSVWGLASNLLAPLFQNGQLRANVDLAAAGVDERVAAHVGRVLRAYAEVEAGLAAEEMLGARVEHLAQSAAQSIAAQGLAEQRYRSGLEPYITVLESQRRALEAEGALITSQRQQLENRVDIYLALGGGFDLRGQPPNNAGQHMIPEVIKESTE